MRINITIEDNLLAKFDSYCQEKNYDRSEYIRKLLREAMGMEIKQFPVENLVGGKQPEPITTRTGYIAPVNVMKEVKGITTADKLKPSVAIA